MKKVICVLVLYNPSANVLKKNIEAIIGQVDFLWISDNTPSGFKGIQEIISSYPKKIEYALMDGNVGIAKAQNEGIRLAIDHEFDFVYFIDQDSISPDKIVAGLLDEFSKLHDEGYKVGGIGPQPFNRDTGKAYLASVKKGCSIRDGIIEVSELINSASLISVNLFKEVGLMDEALFIDGVDHELCWRARNGERYRFFMVTSLPLSHKLGEGDRFFLGISVKVSTPFRTYYQYRNYFMLIYIIYII